ncbi:MAG: TRAP transporter small permease subunit [Burkholderiales bacterium]
MLNRLSDWLHRACAFVLLPLMVIVVCADVAARYVFNSPLGWAQDLTTLALVAAFIAAIPICTMQDGHIRVETLYENFGPRAKAVADLIGHACGIVFMGLLAYRSLSDVPGMFRRGEGPELLDVPFWPIAGFVGLVSVFIVAIFLVRSAKSVIALCQPAPTGH